MKNLLSFTHPRVVAKLYEFLSSAENKGRYFEERLEPNSCLAPLTSIVEKKYYGSLWCQSYFKRSSFVFSRRKKLIQVCNNLRVSKWWQILIFGWSIPLTANVFPQLWMLKALVTEQIIKFHLLWLIEHFVERDGTCHHFPKLH